MIIDHLNDTAKQAGDAMSVGALVASLFDYLPQFTALLVAVWTILRLYESWQKIQINRKVLLGKLPLPRDDDD